MKSRAKLSIDARRPLRHAMEIRHESFCDPSFIDLLREYNIALVIAETAKRYPMMHDITADFIYMRLHGDKTHGCETARAGRRAIADTQAEFLNGYFAVIQRRSSQPKNHCTSNASDAAGTAPSRIKFVSSSRMPVRMG